jgi:hypothetical protein
MDARARAYACVQRACKVLPVRLRLLVRTTACGLDLAVMRVALLCLSQNCAEHARTT